MADYLDVNLAICEIDPVTNQIKATPYFEDYLYKIVSDLGGESSTLVKDIAAISLEADKFPYFFSLVRTLSRQVDEIDRTIDSPILNAKIKSIQSKLSELEKHFDTDILLGYIKEINVRTANFTSKIKTVDYTAINKDWVEARNGIKVTFPVNPVRDDEIMVSNGDGSTIKIYGNGYKFKYKDSDTTFITRNKGSSFHFQFFQDLGEQYWRVR